MTNIATGAIDEQAPWMARIAATHKCRQVGGLAFCDRCGSVAMVPQSRSRLFAECPATAEGWTIPAGSKNRLERLRRGKYPEEGKVAVTKWPNGMAAHLRLPVTKVTTAAAPMGQADVDQHASSSGEEEEDEVETPILPPGEMVRALEAKIMGHVKKLMDAGEPLSAPACEKGFLQRRTLEVALADEFFSARLNEVLEWRQYEWHDVVTEWLAQIREGVHFGKSDRQQARDEKYAKYIFETEQTEASFEAYAEKAWFLMQSNGASFELKLEDLAVLLLVVGAAMLQRQIISWVQGKDWSGLTEVQAAVMSIASNLA